MTGINITVEPPVHVEDIQLEFSMTGLSLFPLFWKNAEMDEMLAYLDDHTLNNANLYCFAMLSSARAYNLEVKQDKRYTRKKL